MYARAAAALSAVAAVAIAAVVIGPPRTHSAFGLSPAPAAARSAAPWDAVVNRTSRQMLDEGRNTRARATTTTDASRISPPSSTTTTRTSSSISRRPKSTT